MHAVIDFTVAVRTDRAHKPGIVWAAIAEAAVMMGFEIGLALRSDEGRRLSAALTDSSASREDVAPDNG